MKKKNNTLIKFEVYESADVDGYDVKISTNGDRTIIQTVDYLGGCASALFDSIIKSTENPNPFEIKDMVMQSINDRINILVNEYYDSIAERGN